MAYQSIWTFTDLPEKMIDIIEEDLTKFDNNMAESRLHGNFINLEKRNSSNAWIPTSYWVGGFIWHYIQKSNRENFLYDISNIDAETIQYTRYCEGEYYGWHNDAGITNLHYSGEGINSKSLEEKGNNYLITNTEYIRKLSFILQLSNSDDYEGGNVQILDEQGKTYFVPRKKGTIAVFDSRSQHRVLKVTKGVRKSLVGWVVGPRWK